jgi:peroxiredoxin
VHDALVKRGGRLLVVSSDSQQEAKDAVEAQDLKFQILTDPDAQVIRQFGLLHPAGSPQKKDIAIPAHLLIAPDGKVLFRFHSTRAQERLDPQEILKVIP